MLLMAERIRMFFDTDDALRLAVNMEALKAGVNVSEFLSALVRRELAEAVTEAERVIGRRGPRPAPKRGRKPKGGA